MAVEMAIWRIDESLNPISLGGMDYEQELQEIIATDLSIVDPNLMMIGREVATPGGRIDALAIDADGNLVVIELKRGRTPRDVVAQTLDYGSWIRGMSSEEIANTYLDYRRRFSGEAAANGINDALRERFNSVPDELNSSHRLIVVAAELDPPTERIVRYLKEEYDVNIDVVIVRAFRDGDSRYLTRAWLNDPSGLSPEPSPRAKGEWNGEFYVSFGEGEHRRWNDAKEYGFVSAGGGDWYVRTLGMLQPGDRIWVSVPGKGYVGVGNVTRPAAHYGEFKVTVNGAATPITEVELKTQNAFDEEYDQHFVGVEWVKTVEVHQAVKERGFFGNQNIVAKPRDPKWRFTVERLKALWNVE